MVFDFLGVVGLGDAVVYGVLPSLWLFVGVVGLVGSVVVSVLL